jgi:asparagine synthase (glutamine-hydrolysing)
MAKHARRPEGWLDLTSSLWPSIFETNDPGVSGFPIEQRYPFFDVRVMTWLLSIPAVPWCDNKEVLRSAMAGLLPKPLLRRPKAACSAQASIAVPLPRTVPLRTRRRGPLGEDPICEILSREESAWVDRFEATPELAEYVVRERIPRLFRERDRTRSWANLRPLSLNYWLPRRNDFLASAKTSLGKLAPGVADPSRRRGCLMVGA